MLIKNELAAKMMEQVGNEFGAALQYLAIAIYFKQEAFDHTAEFFYKQADEEKEHGMKLLKYVVETGGEATVPAIPAPKAVVKTAEDAFKVSLAWETEVTGQINKLMDLAKQQNDYLAQKFLDWFVEEQLEEVTTMEKFLLIVRKLGNENVYLLENFIKHDD
jgi:ferritin